MCALRVPPSRHAYKCAALSRPLLAPQHLHLLHHSMWPHGDVQQPQSTPPVHLVNLAETHACLLPCPPAPRPLPKQALRGQAAVRLRASAAPLRSGAVRGPYAGRAVCQKRLQAYEGAPRSHFKAGCSDLAADVADNPQVGALSSSGTCKDFQLEDTVRQINPPLSCADPWRNSKSTAPCSHNRRHTRRPEPDTRNQGCLTSSAVVVRPL